MQALVGRVTDRRLITYGANPQADVRAENISYKDTSATYDIVFRERGKEIGRINKITLPMPGVHNVFELTAGRYHRQAVGGERRTDKIRL